MIIRSCAIVMFLGVLTACGKSNSATRVSLPPAFAKEGRVCNTSTSAGADHLHDLASWKVKAGESRVVIHERPSGAKYIQVLGSEMSELQNADFLVINESSDPVYSKEEYLDGCNRNVEPKAFKADANVPDFVFAFAVTQVPNGPDSPEKTSPHAIIYLPINIGRLPASEAQEFQILMFHMEPKKDECPTESGADREQCVSLWELRALWQQGGYTEDQMKKAVAERIRAMLKAGAPMPNPLPSRNRNSYQTYFLSEARYHNGVIHGTF
jgi:hypothetical protein